MFVAASSGSSGDNEKITVSSFESQCPIKALIRCDVYENRTGEIDNNVSFQIFQQFLPTFQKSFAQKQTSVGVAKLSNLTRATLFLSDEPKMDKIYNRTPINGFTHYNLGHDILFVRKTSIRVELHVECFYVKLKWSNTQHVMLQSLPLILVKRFSHSWRDNSKNLHLLLRFDIFFAVNHCSNLVYYKRKRSFIYEQ